MELLPEKPGQAAVMTITSDDVDTHITEQGHWYSPAQVAKFIAEVYETCAVLSEENAAAGKDAKEIAQAIRSCSTIEKVCDQTRSQDLLYHWNAL